MLTALFAGVASLFGTSGFGALMGWLGGLANRWFDLKSKSMDMEILKIKNEQELLIRDKDLEQIKFEWESRSKVAQIEGEAKVAEAAKVAEGAIESAAYAALSASYSNDKATYGIMFIDGVRGLIRPLITLIFTGIAIYINAEIMYLLTDTWATLSQVDKVKLVFTVVDWMLFQTSVVVGWWFANRPGRQTRI